ncbi:HEAT repeat domain-containing protein [Natronorubrum sp. FCH18a]|uniref:HEAT repeat domain-containing protein n=1 Tax=Natronorubrum sp. FCH18a TaxID=3447018 RepID=UPI003F5198DD
MDGEGGEAVEQRRVDGNSFELPSVLAQLDTNEPTDQRAAVDTIRETLPERPGACVPTVPKLRALLEQPTLEFHDEVAYCLAELAAESPADVAPSVDVIVTFAEVHADAPATRELLRCLATVAAERPTAVAEHTATIADVVDRRSGYDDWGLRAIQRVSRTTPSATHSALPVLTDALAADPESNGVSVLPTLGRLTRSETPPETLAFVEQAIELVDHDEPPLRRNAVGCLADVAHHAPSAVESACADLGGALESADPETRANAAVVIARVTAETDRSVGPAREPLLALLTDDFDRARANACVALGHGRVEAAADRLETLADEDPSSTVRERADWALDRIA